MPDLRPIYTIDIETDPFKENRFPMPFACDVFDGDEHFTFWGPNCLNEAVIFLFDKDVLCYAHNGGKFDYHYLLHWLNPGDAVHIINGRLSKFWLGACEFRDSFNLIPYSLASYQKEVIDYTLFEAENREAAKPEILAYLHKDTEYLHELITGFITGYGNHLTQAGAAFKFWQKFSKTKVTPTDREYYEKFSPYYYGGRVEAIKPGLHHGNFMAVDINSAYPFAMLGNHPWGAAYFEGGSTVAEVERNVDTWKTAFFTVEGVSRGAFPFRDVDTMRLTFPRDSVRRVYHVTGHELYAALENETFEFSKCIHMICHNDQINFSDYISHFYQLRLEAKATGDKMLDLFCKIFMNSLYGKFGANPDNYFDYVITNLKSLPKREAMGWKFAGTLGPNLMVSKPQDDHDKRFYNLATAASITGAVRAQLWQALNLSTNPLYCDTDCIIAESAPVKMSKMLGDWELEGAYDFVAIGGKKIYALRDKETGDFKCRSKGVRLNQDEIIRLCDGETISYTRDVPTYSVKKTPSFSTRNVRML